MEERYENIFREEYLYLSFLFNERTFSRDKISFTVEWEHISTR